MSKKAHKIVSIDIELEDFEPIHLKMDEARELYEQLHDLFGDKQQVVQHQYVPWYQQPYYTWYNQTPTVTTIASDFGDSGSTSAMCVSDRTGMKVSFNAQSSAEVGMAV